MGIALLLTGRCLGRHLSHHLDTVRRCGEAGVGSEMEHELKNLLLLNPVSQGVPDVLPRPLLLPAYHQHRNSDQLSRPIVQTISGPDPPPDELRGDLTVVGEYLGQPLHRLLRSLLA